MPLESTNGLKGHPRGHRYSQGRTGVVLSLSESCRPEILTSELVNAHSLVPTGLRLVMMFSLYRGELLSGCLCRGEVFLFGVGIVV